MRLNYLNESIIQPRFDDLTEQANALNDIRCLLNYFAGSLGDDTTPVIVTNPPNSEGSFIALVNKDFTLPTEYRENSRIPFVITKSGFGYPVMVQEGTLKELGLENKHICSFKDVEPKKYLGLREPLSNVVIVHPDSGITVGARKVDELLLRDHSSLKKYYKSLVKDYYKSF